MYSPSFTIYFFFGIIIFIITQQKVRSLKVGGVGYVSTSEASTKVALSINQKKG
jgi:hypothetical protein